jgi:hypothetical protein
MTSGPSPIRIVSLTRHRPRRYDEAVRRALPVLWEASDRACSKRLKALLPVLLDALERHQRLRLDPATRVKLTRISAATIDRLLVEARAAGLIDRPRRSPSVPRHSSPIQRYASRSFLPGEVYLRWEAGGSGDTMDRRPCTLVLVDLFSGWTDYALLLAPHPSAVIQRLAELCTRLPFTLRGITLSSELEFSTTALEHYCRGLGLALTQARRSLSSPAASHLPAAGSPDLSGDAVLEADGATCDALLRLNVATSSFINFFHVSFRLQDHPLDRSIVSRVHALGTPCARLLLRTELSPQHKSQLRQQAASLDPMQLLEEVRRMRSHLALLAAGFRLHPRQTGPDTSAPVQMLVAPDGRPVGQGDTPTRARRWRTHQDAFQAAWPTVQAWLQVNPNQTSKVLFARLQQTFPGVYQEGQLRSLQRRLKDWRSRTGSVEETQG